MRYGGDEFIIMLFNKTEHEVMEITEILHSRVNALHYYYNGDQTKQLTLSQGIYFAKPYSDESIFDFILKADKALYRAKKIKNCTEIY